MAEVTQSAYQDIRNHIQENWKFIELRDGAGTAILRLSTDDARVTWEHLAGERELKLQINIKGSDTEITIPQTFGASAVYNVATEGEAFSEETFNAFTVESDKDELTIVHAILVPRTV